MLPCGELPAEHGEEDAFRHVLWHWDPGGVEGCHARGREALLVLEDVFAVWERGYAQTQIGGVSGKRPLDHVADRSADIAALPDDCGVFEALSWLVVRVLVCAVGTEGLQIALAAQRGKFTLSKDDYRRDHADAPRPERDRVVVDESGACAARRPEVWTSQRGHAGELVVEGIAIEADRAADHPACQRSSGDGGSRIDESEPGNGLGRAQPVAGCDLTPPLRKHRPELLEHGILVAQDAVQHGLAGVRRVFDTDEPEEIVSGLCGRHGFTTASGMVSPSVWPLVSALREPLAIPQPAGRARKGLHPEQRPPGWKSPRGLHRRECLLPEQFRRTEFARSRHGPHRRPLRSPHPELGRRTSFSR